MTAQQRYAPGCGTGYAGAAAREQAARGRTAEQRTDDRVMYVYGDRVCVKAAKQRQLYKTYGRAAGFSPEEAARRRRDGGQRGGSPRRKRRKIVPENIVNLFESIEQRGRDAVAAAKKSAVLQKRFTEHRRGLLMALSMTAAFCLFLLLVYNLFFGIRTIYGETTTHYTGEEIAAASGVAVGDGLYSFRADETEARITFYCPYIRSVDVTRTIPDRVGFDVESDRGVYVVNVYGRELVLSESLRVLGTWDPSSEEALVRLCLPEVRYSVAGRAIRFAEERNERFVRDALAVIGAGDAASSVGYIDLRDRDDVVLYSEDMYLLRLGSEQDLAYKLKMAEKTIANPAFNRGTPAEIDLSVTGEACVRYDHTLQLSEGTETAENAAAQ